MNEELSVCDQLILKREIDNLTLDPLPRNWHIAAQAIMDNEPQQYIDILQALATGDSVSKVCTDFNIKRHVVRAMRDRHTSFIGNAQSEAIRRNVNEALHVMSEDMINKHHLIPASKLGYNFGILFDKVLLATGHPTSRVEHVKVSSPEDLQKLYEQLPE